MSVAVITGGAGDLAQTLRRELETQYGNIHTPSRAELDVTSLVSTKTFFATLNRIDLLVLNAGICRDELLLKMDAAQFANVLDCNLTGAMRCAREALRLMAKQRAGHIVFISSFSALSGPVGQANYAASKAGLIALTQSLAKEYGARNIRVNCVLPGFLETRMTQNLDVGKKESVRAAHALGRFNTVETVASFIAFLDRKMPHTSGQVFNLDSRIHRWS